MPGAPISELLDRAVAASPRARALCVALEGRRLQVSATGLPAPLLLSAGSLRCEPVLEAPAQPAADVTVSGSPLALLTLVRGDFDAALANANLGISGDEALAQQFRELARLLRPDFETLLGRVLGRMNAHLAVRALGQLSDWG